MLLPREVVVGLCVDAVVAVVEDDVMTGFVLEEKLTEGGATCDVLLGLEFGTLFVEGMTACGVA